MPANIVYVFLIFLYICSTTSVHSEDKKRLLLNDPATVQSLLHQYETQLNKYGIALQQVESKMAAMENENTKLKRENINMSSSLAHLMTENKNLNSRISVLEGSNGTSIVTYVRWGRTTCVSDPHTELLYKGVTGGSSHRVTGSGVNALCLPHNPDNGVNINGITSYSGQLGTLYGAEYQYNYKNVRIDDDVPCAVCLVKKATSVLMVPAKSSCPVGWRTQYSGILTTNFDGFKQSEYTCMDNEAEYIEGTRINNFDGKLFYPVKAVCGSLPCPPYKNGAIVECAVCTR